MTLKYNIGGKDYDVWVSNNSSVVSIFDKNKEYKRTVHKDFIDSYFTWNNMKVYLGDFKKIPMSVLIKRLKNKEWVTDDALCQSILTDGVENVRFKIPMHVVDLTGLDSYDDVLKTKCKIIEEWNRTVMDNYKLKFYPLENERNVVSYEEYYTMDFVGSIRSGFIEVLPSEF